MKQKFAQHMQFVFQIEKSRNQVYFVFFLNNQEENLVNGRYGIHQQNLSSDLGESIIKAHEEAHDTLHVDVFKKCHAFTRYSPSSS